jgi:hypothetical protein
MSFAVLPADLKALGAQHTKAMETRKHLIVLLRAMGRNEEAKQLEAGNGNQQRHNNNSNSIITPHPQIIPSAPSSQTYYSPSTHSSY